MNEAKVSPERLATLPSLGAGAHSGPDDGMCVMEAVSYIAGEPWSDAPQCACPVITAFLVSWNDALSSNAERDRLDLPSLSARYRHHRHDFNGITWENCEVRMVREEFSRGLMRVCADHRKCAHVVACVVNPFMRHLFSFS